ncbi:MAG TPA: tRNA (N6-threonylcarbamoyladenosine(37)-N6)-methyltransferase TrmO [Solirubrobacterales bacterium]|jgi:tRNA-Thr(GGU) m(6)t(6)A37 methyltransferase TsaA|nr:tRNA (N6-threonylcarbamoyladenosine(37)-N6)-methyltransferase TrmO [Solirubrobacterales bacterium]
MELRPIGRVESPLADRATAPKQGDEGSPEAVLVFDARVGEGLRSLRAGNEAIVLTWLDRADRGVLSVHPRGDLSRSEEGVFSTRSPDRPNPIGLHRVEIVAIDGARLRVRNLEAIDGTPILDLKPVLDRDTER